MFGCQGQLHGAVILLLSCGGADPISVGGRYETTSKWITDTCENDLIDAISSPETHSEAFVAHSPGAAQFNLVLGDVTWNDVDITEDGSFAASKPSTGANVYGVEGSAALLGQFTPTGARWTGTAYLKYSPLENCKMILQVQAEKVGSRNNVPGHVMIQ